MKTCPSCGTQSDNKFCPECGMDLASVPDEVVCPNCGTKSTAKFCPECGTNLTDSSDGSIIAEPVTPQSDDSVVASISEEAVVTSEETLTEASSNHEMSREIPVEASVAHETKPKKSKKKMFIIAGAILLVLIIIGAVAGSGGGDTTATTSNETESYYEEEETTEPTTAAPVDEFTKEEDYESISYDKLARNPDDYEGKMVKGSGNVLQVMDGEDEVDLRIGTSSDGYDDVVYVYYNPEIVDSRILEDDHVTYYGESLGLYTYESTMGGEITIPLVKIHKITRD